MVFMALKELFKSIVIFFGLTNSSAMFQVIINKSLWDLINIREVVSFINNIIVEIEKRRVQWSSKRDSKEIEIK